MTTLTLILTLQDSARTLNLTQGRSPGGIIGGRSSRGYHQGDITKGNLPGEFTGEKSPASVYISIHPLLHELSARRCPMPSSPPFSTCRHSATSCRVCGFLLLTIS